MIDLKQLEERLDNILNSETKESLTNWLSNKRSQNKTFKRDVCYCGSKDCYICGGTPIAK